MSAVSLSRHEQQNALDAEVVQRKMLALAKRAGCSQGVMNLVAATGDAFVSDILVTGEPIRIAEEQGRLRADLNPMLDELARRVLRASLKAMEEEQQRHRQQLPRIVAWFAEHVFFANQFAVFREFKRIVEGL